MKFKLNSNKYFKWGITAFSVIVAGLLVCYLIFNASEFLGNINKLLSVGMPVAVGLVIAYLLTPIVNFLEGKVFLPLCKKMKIKESKTRSKLIRAISILLTIVLVIFVIYVLIAMLISQIVPSIQNIISNFDSYIRNITEWMNKLPVENEELYGYITTMFTRMMTEVENWLEDTANVMNRSTEILKTLSLSVISFLSVTWNVIIGFIISIYVLAGKETFVGQAKKVTYALFDKPTANSVIESVRFTHRTFSGFISGKILDSLIIGILCFIGTSLIGTPYASLVSVIIGVTNIIPFFGPYLGAIPSAVLILIVDLTHPLNCVYFLIFILILQQFDGNFLGPLILGDSTGLSGFWVIFSITVFGGLFGIMGMIVGVPAFAVFYAGIKGIVNASLKKKALPTDTELYLHVHSIDEEGFHKMKPVAGEKSTSHQISATGRLLRKIFKLFRRSNADNHTQNKEKNK
ncbi:MAG: AI-2E family transporter [Lachnospiraceae bacterium]|nr:AI-2E family transporter [Lachnospiraceae bacterium]